MSAPTTTAAAAKRGRRTGNPAGDDGLRLVIVESPAKAKKIADYLGPGYVVEASIGHIRDLPRNADDVPAKYKGESWARLGVDVDREFAPLYVVSPDRRAQVAKLKQLVKDATELYLATDEDREGEAIAWHLVEELRPRVPVRRMVFHEITRPAILEAVANPRELNLSLVDAQETRRILDRLYGYEVSPVLWKKVMPRLSAGRVQSVATRIVVERERARMKFRSAEYWDIRGQFAVNGEIPAGEPSDFLATLVGLDGDRVATGRDFEPTTGQLKNEARGAVIQLDEAGARGLAARLEGAAFKVTRVEEKPYRRKPYAPFMTSTLQQEASRKLRFAAEQTMRVAQRLYENGYITYMRTDSTNLSETALNAARQQVRELYGDRYVPTEPRRYARKVKNAQEAHEAIRPSGEHFRTPGELARELSSDEFRLYELIWKRTIASQMIDAVGQSVSVRLSGTSSTNEVADFAASGRTITEPGFLRAYVEDIDESHEGDGSDGQTDDSERRLPRLAKDDPLTAHDLVAEGHNTQPPPRYTEASLVKALEELGIGRPSTYASIMRTIQDRGYVWKKGAALVPSFIAFAVVQLLEQYFPRLVDYKFTANVEEDLDDIAAGERRRVDWLTRFYFGAPEDANVREESVSRAGGLKHLVALNLGDIDARGVNSIPLFTDEENRSVVVRVGRYGPYLQRTSSSDEEGERASLPDDLEPDSLTPERATELLSAPQGGREVGVDPSTNEPVVAKAGRFGPYVQSGDRTSSLFDSMSLETLTLDDALKLLSLPRTLGAHPDDKEPVTAQNGRYGPYVKHGSESRSLGSEDELFTVTLDQALALLAQPKTRGRRSAPAAPLREMNANDPISGQPMVIKDGRFGPYVTDGETNASLRKGDEVESLTPERAAELLADRRARGPAKKTTRKKAPAKKAASSESAAKKTATKKTTTKKTAAKKTTATKKAAPKKTPAKAVKE
ncbi:type I DNA topoisomerase [Cryptosporangium minutisporangium]|uniref:DNA topoisomerase 1 n=1 Tax=Cryptosporangium minutisporangium TaxID=113569 RepID=A0ABP6SY98_9ACTN